MNYHRLRSILLAAAGLALLLGLALSNAPHQATFAAQRPGQPFDFAAPLHYSGANLTSSMLAQGDFNEDSFMDLAASQWGPQRVGVSLNNAAGAFPATTSYLYSPNSLWALDIGDVNGDNHLDIVSAHRSGNQIAVLLGGGDGTFQRGATLGAISEPTDVRLGDLNADGKLDIVTAHSTSTSISVRLGVGNGTFNAPIYTTAGARPYALAIGNLNGDAAPDVIVANQNSDNVSVLLGDGDGTFAAQVTYPVGDNPLQVRLADINGDGNQDIAVTNRYSNTVSLLQGNGAGLFETNTNIVAANQPNAVGFSDLNSDGNLDMLVSRSLDNVTPGYVGIYVGNGDGTFQAPVDFITGVNPVSILLADYNHDGVTDIATGNYNGAYGISVLLGVNLAPPTATATATATATSQPSPTATATATATSQPSSTATATSQPSPTATAGPAGQPSPTATAGPAGQPSNVYLPRIALEPPLFPIAINRESIATRPIIQRGEVYYTATISLDGQLPSGGHFYLSSMPDRALAILVDDKLTVKAGGETLFMTERTQPAVVEIARAEIETWQGKTLTVEFSDEYGSVVGSSPVWLIWMP